MPQATDPLALLADAFAVYAAAIATGQFDPIERAEARAAGCAALRLDLDRVLNDLNVEHRSAAFAVATARVWRAIQAHGLRQVFANLTRPERDIAGKRRWSTRRHTT